jgi:hypothetical protein
MGPQQPLLIGIGAFLIIFSTFLVIVRLGSQYSPTATYLAVGSLSTMAAILGIRNRRRKRERDWAKPLLRNIWIAFIKQLPDDSTSADLTLMNADPAEPRISISPSDDLQKAVRCFHLAARKEGLPWKRLVIHVRRESDGWQSKADFDYGGNS